MEARGPRTGVCRPADLRSAESNHAGAGPCRRRPGRRPSAARARERLQPPQGVARSGAAALPREVGEGDPGMAAISDLVSAVIDKPVAAAARLARRALERIAPEPEGKAEAAPRKSKGWRKHLRRVKARERDARG